MIAKGAARNNPRQLAVYLMRVERYETGEPVELLELQSGWASALKPGGDRLRDASRVIETFRDWQFLAEGTKQGRDGLYHAEVSPAPEYAAAMTPEQWKRAADILGEELGLQDQPRAVFLHGGTDGRKHMHIVWARTDVETMKFISDGYNYVAHEKASHRMELEFGHEFVPGKHDKRDRKLQEEFPRQEYDYAEAQIAERTGMTVAERKAQIAALKLTAANGLEFKQALEEAGYLLAKGERGYIVVDDAGVLSALSKNLGMKKAQVEGFMADVPLNQLPTIEEAKALQKQRALAAQHAETGEISAAERKEQITALRQQADSAQAFKNALEEAGYILARGDKRDFLLVDEQGKTFSLSRQVTDIKGKEYKAFMAPLDPAPLPDVEEARAIVQQRVAEARKQGLEASKFLTPEVAQKLEERAPSPPAPEQKPAPQEPPAPSPAYDPSLYSPQRQAEITPPLSKFLPPPLEKPDVAAQQNIAKVPEAPVPPPTAVQPPAPKPADLSLYAPSRAPAPPPPEYLKNHVQGLMAFADSAAAFKASLEEAGFRLAQGDRGYLLFDKENNAFALTSVVGQRQAFVDAYMSPIPLSSLPTVKKVFDEQNKPQTPQPPAPIAGTPAGWAPKDQELYDLERALAQRARQEMEQLKELHAQQIRYKEVELDREIVEKMVDYKAIQDEQTRTFRAARQEHRTGIRGLIDAIQSRINPTLAAEKAQAREKEFRDFYRRLAKERADYEVLLQQTKKEQMDFLHETQAYERSRRENKNEEEHDRYVRDYHESKRIAAEMEAEQLKHELERKHDFGEGPEPPQRGK